MASAIHLDTNFLIYYVGGGDEEVIRNVVSCLLDGHTLHASAMARAECQCGPLQPDENVVAGELLEKKVAMDSGAVGIAKLRLWLSPGHSSTFFF